MGISQSELKKNRKVAGQVKKGCVGQRVGTRENVWEVRC